MTFELAFKAMFPKRGYGLLASAFIVAMLAILVSITHATPAPTETAIPSPLPSNPPDEGLELIYPLSDAVVNLNQPEFSWIGLRVTYRHEIVIRNATGFLLAWDASRYVVGTLRRWYLRRPIRCRMGTTHGRSVRIVPMAR